MARFIADNSEPDFLASFGNSDLSAIVGKFCPDLPRSEILAEWNDVKCHLAQDPKLVERSLLYIFQSVINAQKANILSSPNVVVLLARILAASPHNMYVERAISAYDLLKTDDRSSLQRECLNDYLHVKLNMPPVADYDPRPAIQRWWTDVRRRPNQTPTGKYEAQEYLVGFFSDATDEKSDMHKLTDTQF